MVGRYRFGIGQGFIQGIHQVTGPWVRAFLPRSRRGGRCGLTTLRWGRGRVFAPVATTTLTGRVGGQHHTRMKHTRRRGACPHRGDRASFRSPGTAWPGHTRRRSRQPARDPVTGHPGRQRLGEVVGPAAGGRHRVQRPRGLVVRAQPLQQLGSADGVIIQVTDGGERPGRMLQDQTAMLFRGQAQAGLGGDAVDDGAGEQGSPGGLGAFAGLDPPPSSPLAIVGGVRDRGRRLLRARPPPPPLVLVCWCSCGWSSWVRGSPVVGRPPLENRTQALTCGSSMERGRRPSGSGRVRRPGCPRKRGRHPLEEVEREDDTRDGPPVADMGHHGLGIHSQPPSWPCRSVVRARQVLPAPVGLVRFEVGGTGLA